MIKKKGSGREEQVNFPKPVVAMHELKVTLIFYRKHYNILQSDDLEIRFESLFLH